MASLQLEIWRFINVIDQKVMALLPQMEKYHMDFYQVVFIAHIWKH